MSVGLGTGGSASRSFSALSVGPGIWRGSLVAGPAQVRPPDACRSSSIQVLDRWLEEIETQQLIPGPGKGRDPARPPLLRPRGWGASKLVKKRGSEPCFPLLSFLPYPWRPGPPSALVSAQADKSCAGGELPYEDTSRLLQVQTRQLASTCAPAAGSPHHFVRLQPSWSMSLLSSPFLQTC